MVVAEVTVEAIVLSMEVTVVSMVITVAVAVVAIIVTVVVTVVTYYLTGCRLSLGDESKSCGQLILVVNHIVALVPHTIEVRGRGALFKCYHLCHIKLVLFVVDKIRSRSFRPVFSCNKRKINPNY